MQRRDGWGRGGDLTLSNFVPDLLAIPYIKPGGGGALICLPSTAISAILEVHMQKFSHEGG